MAASKAPIVLTFDQGYTDYSDVFPKLELLDPELVLVILVDFYRQGHAELVAKLKECNLEYLHVAPKKNHGKSQFLYLTCRVLLWRRANSLWVYLKDEASYPVQVLMQLAEKLKISIRKGADTVGSTA